MNHTMTVEEAKAFLRGMILKVICRSGSNYDDERYLRVECVPESNYLNPGPGGPHDIKSKFEEAVRVLAGG